MKHAVPSFLQGDIYKQPVPIPSYPACILGNNLLELEKVSAGFFFLPIIIDLHPA